MSPKRRRSESDDGDNERDEIEASIDLDVEGSPAEAEPVAQAAPVKNKRGRPPGSKNKKPDNIADAGEAGPSNAPPPVKRPRGRPRKPRTAEQLAAEEAKAAMPKRPRGRPKKQKVEPQPQQPTSDTIAPVASSSTVNSSQVQASSPHPPTSADRSSRAKPASKST